METTSGVMPVYNLADNGRSGWNDEYIWIILFFILFGYGNGGFGNNNGAVTTDFLLNQTSAINENILRQTNTLGNGICDSTYALNNAIGNVGTQVQSASADNRYEMSNGFCGVNRNIDNLRYDMAEKFCQVYHNQATDKAEILQAIHNTACEGQIRELERENLVLSQKAQTTTILAAVQDMLKDTYSI